MTELPDADAIRASLPPETMWRDIRVVETTGSTNEDLAAEARDGGAEGIVLVAMEQTAGRGRLERRWASPKAASVSMSLLLEPSPGLQQWGWLSLLAGMAVSAALAGPGGGRIGLKWPNDVLISGRKVCGILSEGVDTPGGAKAVVGIGINVLLEADELPVPGATSLKLEGLPTGQSGIVAAVLSQFEQLYRLWQPIGSLREQYQCRCSSIGATLTMVLGPGQHVPGTGVGVDEQGRLLVDTGTGIRAFAAGDVVHASLAG